MSGGMIEKKNTVFLGCVSETLRIDSEITLHYLNERYKTTCRKAIKTALEKCNDPKIHELAEMIKGDVESDIGLKIGFPFGILVTLLRAELSETELRLALET